MVEEPLDIVALERTGQFTGTYHVLGGVISPIDGIGPEQLHIPELIDRIKSDNVQEVIIATMLRLRANRLPCFTAVYPRSRTNYYRIAPSAGNPSRC